MCVQLTFITNQNKSISYTRKALRGYDGLPTVIFVLTSHRRFLNSMIFVCFMRMSNVEFSNCLTAEHRRSWWNILLNLWTAFSVLFFLGHILLRLALQHGRDLKCHSEWPPPHLWKLRWRETGALLSLFSSFCSFLFCVRALKLGTFTNLLRLSLKEEKRRFIISAVPIMNGIPLWGKSI